MTKMNLWITALLIALVVPAVAQRGGGSGRDTASGGRNTATGNMRIPTSAEDPNKGTTTTKRPPAEIQFNEALATKLKTMLPEGVDPHKASKGFESLKDFVGAVRVANNLNVSFVELKRNMADGSNKELQKAIHALKPDADPKAEIKKAGEQAKQDIKESKQS